MDRRIKKRILAAILTCTLIFPSVVADGVHTYAAAEETAVEELGVQFDQEYAVVGKKLSVTAVGGDSLRYSWYVDDEKLANTSNTYIPTEKDLESMIRVVVSNGSKTAETSMYFSKLPVVYIDTNGQQITSKTEYINADMQIQGNEQYNTDTTTLYHGAIQIRGRGNSTWGMPKKPYKIKLDKKTDVFGMGKNKHWVLLANYSDESLMRNTLSYDFSGALEMEHMSTVWTSVVMNGEYVGNYQFCEQIRVDKTRVDIFDWEGLAEDAAEIIAQAEGMSDVQAAALADYMLEKDMSWITTGGVTFQNKTYDIKDYPSITIPSIDGGYLLELDEYYDEVSKFRTDSGQPVMFKNPEYVYTNTEMMNYVQNYIQTFEDAVRSWDYTADYEGEAVHYSDLYDFESLVDYWLVNEIFFNEELNKKSTYMYKETGELMKMGPVWDMDYSSGGEGQTYQTEQWATLYYSANAQSSQWYKYLVKDPYFFIKAQERYWEIRYKETTDMIASIDQHYEYLKESGAADSAYWSKTSGRHTSFEQDVSNLKDWMNKHITWLDSQMETEDTLEKAFYKTNVALQLSLTDTEGEMLDREQDVKAKADAVVTLGQDIRLSVNGTSIGKTATVFVNGRVFGNVTVGESLLIPASALTESVGTKNVIEVKVSGFFGNNTNANYITVKQKKAEAQVTPTPTPTPTVRLPYVDVEEQDWFYDAVSYNYDKKVMTGINEFCFAPYEQLSRAQFVLMLYRLEGEPEAAFGKTFSDVIGDEWYGPAVYWAAEKGIVTGYEDGCFGPADLITREQMAVMLYRYAVSLGDDTSTSSTLDGFLDKKLVSGFSETAVKWTVERGIMTGKEQGTRLDPQGYTTRAEAAVMIQRFFEKSE